MFSIADMAVAGAVALLLFGPDQLPKVARRAGQLVRDVQNTSQSFIREMERAADTPHADVYTGPVYPAASEAPAAPLYHETPAPAPHELVAREAALQPSITGDVRQPEGPVELSFPADPGNYADAAGTGASADLSMPDVIVHTRSGGSAVPPEFPVVPSAPHLPPGESAP